MNLLNVFFWCWIWKIRITLFDDTDDDLFDGDLKMDDEELPKA